MNVSQHLFLTGFRGTGKSTVGAILGRRLDRSTIDLDQRIEQLAAKSIREIFDQGGETLFRELETTALQQVVAFPAAVVSLGGGAILRESNRDLLLQSGVCFWLDADAETVARRLRNDTTSGQRRPALTNLPELDEIRHLLQQRQPLYALAADHRIETDGKSAEEVAEEILVLWGESPGIVPA
jgi:shikimate kinase